MPDEVIVTPSIIIPASIIGASLPNTQIIHADIPQLRIQMFLLQTELGIPEELSFTRKEIDQILKNIPKEKAESLVNFLRIQIILNNFEQVESWTKACLDSVNFRSQPEFYFVRAEVNYHQGFFKDAEFYLIMSGNFAPAHPLYVVQMSLEKQMIEFREILSNRSSLDNSDFLNQLKCLEQPPFVPFLRKALEVSYEQFQQKEYLDVYRIIEPLHNYNKKLGVNITPEMKLLDACLKTMLLASQVGLYVQYHLDNYDQLMSDLSSLSGLHFQSDLKMLLYHPSEEIRNPISRVLKEHASKFIDCCNSMGVALFEQGAASYNPVFFERARDIYKIQDQLIDILYPNIRLSREAKIHVLTNLNNSDIALARDDFSGAFKPLISAVDIINHTDDNFPVTLAAATSLRLGTMSHALYVHLNQCLKFVSSSKTRCENFPVYLRENHPEFLGVWRDQLNGIRGLKDDDFNNLNRQAGHYQGNSAYSYRQFQGFPPEVRRMILEQSNWTQRDLIDNVLALGQGQPPEHHSFLPLGLQLAS